MNRTNLIRGAALGRTALSGVAISISGSTLGGLMLYDHDFTAPKHLEEGEFFAYERMYSE